MYIKDLPQDMQQLAQTIKLFFTEQSSLRRADMKKRMDYYFDKQIKYLEDNLKEQFTQYKKMKLQLEFYNITNIVISEIACIYSQEPKRELINGTDKDVDIYNSIIKDGKLNLVLAQINTLTKLCKTVILNVVWRNDKIDFDIITPDIFEVLQNTFDFNQMDGYIYAVSSDNTQLLNNDDTINNDLANRQNTVYNFWSKDKNIIFSMSGNTQVNIKTIETNLDNENPYGVIPAVVFRDGIPLKSFYIEGGEDIINANEIINIKKTEINYLTKMQSFSIPVKKGGDKDDITILDPSMIINIPCDDEVHKGSDFKFVTPDAKIEDMLMSIRDKLISIAIKYKIDPDIFAPSGARQSGDSLRIKAEMQSRLIERDRPFYRIFESELFNIIRIVNNYHNTQKISDSAELVVDFIETELPKTLEEEDQHNLLLYNNGLISKADWLMAENPDITTKEQAEEVLAQINIAKPTINPEIPQDEDNQNLDNE